MQAISPSDRKLVSRIDEFKHIHLDNSQFVQYEDKQQLKRDLEEFLLSLPIQSIIWLHLGSSQIHLTDTIIKCGFQMHNCNAKEIVFIKAQSTSPKFSTHVVGAAGLVFNKKQQILLIQEKQGMMKGFWGLPGVNQFDQGEKITQAGVREVKEETNLDVEVRDLLLMIERPLAKYRKGNLYIVMIMRMLDDQQIVEICDRELSAFQWVDLQDLSTFIKNNKTTGTLVNIDRYFKGQKNTNPHERIRFTIDENDKSTTIFRPKL